MIKKISETIIGLVTVFAIILGCAENPDGSCNLAWTLSCFAVAGVCGWIWTRLQPKPLHITDEAYIDLQGQIQHAVDTADEDCTLEIDAKLPDDAAIYITLEMRVSTSESKFTDGAWGAVQAFTEVNREYALEITRVEVFDENGKERESDFDEGNLNLEFETTNWE